MQYDSFMQNMDTNTSVTAGWMNALSGSATLENPSTGNYYTVNTSWQSYQHYCVGSGGVTAFNGSGSCGVYQTALTPVD